MTSDVLRKSLKSVNLLHDSTNHKWLFLTNKYSNILEKPNVPILTCAIIISRKDLISAMKLPDNEPLTPSSYWIITDTWKQDWERGVQVPVNPDSLPAPKVEIIDNPQPPNFQEFKL